MASQDLRLALHLRMLPLSHAAWAGFQVTSSHLLTPALGAHDEEILHWLGSYATYHSDLETNSDFGGE